MDLEAIKNIKYIFKRLLQIKKALWNFKYLFPFFLFKDWVLETQLRIEFLTPTVGVWNQLHKTLHVSLFLCLSSISVWRYCRKSRVKSAFRAQLWHLSLVLNYYGTTSCNKTGTQVQVREVCNGQNNGPTWEKGLTP